MSSRVSAVILLACASLLRLSASEADALAISRDIQARHLIYGTVLDPVFASPGSDQIVGYSRCGDSAIWTGHYLAAEAFRYKVTHSADALANAQRAVAGLKSLVDVTGNNVLARCLVPDDSPYGAGIQAEEAHNGIYRSGPGNFWVGNTSRDQYSGAMFGLGVAYDLVDDAGLKSTIAALITRMVDFLRGKGWAVVMPNGSVSTTFVIRPDQKLAFLQLARHVNPDHFSTAYDLDRVLLSTLIITPISVEVLEDNAYSKFNLDSINLYTLIHLESSSFQSLYRKAYDVLRHHTEGHANAFFNMIDGALNGPNAGRDAETRTLLDQWLERPRRDVYVDVSKQVQVCGDHACDPIPVPLRVTTDFIWQRSPFQLAGGGSGTIETAGIDYILPYWMARYYGVIAGSGPRAVSAASGAPLLAPESMATLFGSNLAAATETASTQPPPLALGGVSVMVKDSAGASRPAPLYFASPGQINFLVPAGMAAGTATIAVQSAGAPDRNAQVEVQPVAPAFFTVNASGHGIAAATAMRVTAGRVDAVPVFTCGASGCAAVPIDLSADAPVYLSLYGTGLRQRSSLAGVTCSIGGVSVPVLYAGPQPDIAGLDQVNVALPASLRGLGETDVVVTVDGKPANPVRINVR